MTLKFKQEYLNALEPDILTQRRKESLKFLTRCAPLLDIVVRPP